MNTRYDDHDIRKDKLVDAQIANAEDKAQVAAFGKAAYEAADKYMRENDRFWIGAPEWKDVRQLRQCAWVAAAQAVLDEARRCGWL